MSSAGRDGRGRNRQLGLLVLALALLALAGVIAAYRLHNTDQKAAARAEAQVRLFCTACNLEFDMPYSEYQRQAPKGTDVWGPLDCPKCGGKKCVVRARVNEDEAIDGSPDDEPAREQPAAPGIQ